jgi:protein-S-isoprenylcysteine O-methyltransferase Ste14
MPLVAIYGPLVTLVVAGLDRRWGWRPEVPWVWALIGAALLVLASAFAAYAMLTNRFFSAVVRIQRERGHTVVTAGPYRWVRHPGYAGGVACHLAMPILLGSLWALIPGVLTAGLTVLRTALEDRTLRAELPGYSEYARRTRYRLLPGVW